MSAREPATADEVRSLAYLDGALAPEEAAAFELRLGREPELRARFEELARVDDELRAALGDGRVELAARRWRALPRRAWPAAALLVALLGAFLWTRARGGGPAGFELALVATAPSDAGLNERLGLPADWLPAGMGYRAAGAEAAPTPPEYARAVEEALRQRVAAAWGAPTAPAEAGAFLLAFRPQRDCAVVLLAVGEARAAERLLPRGVPRRFEGGETHLLPRAPVELPADWRAAQRVDYAPGVLTRRGVVVVLGARAQPPDSALLAELDAECARLGHAASAAERAGTLAAWLTERGFACERRAVRSP